MTISLKTAPHAGPSAVPPARDFQEHLALLEKRGLVVRVDRPINKDTELHPLARWQFQGAIPDEKRRAFVFTNPVRLWTANNPHFFNCTAVERQASTILAPG